MSAIPWDKYFEMTEDGEHILPEAYELLESLLETRGLYQWGWNPRTRQSGIGIKKSAEAWEIEEALEAILPFRRPDEDGFCAVGIPNEREDCSFSLLVTPDLKCVELRKHRYGGISMICRMPSLEYALTFMDVVGEDYWDEEKIHKMLFPDIAHIDQDTPQERTSAVIIKESKALEGEQAH
jgi:hypothetical protein